MLTDAKVRNARPRERPFKVSDERGLHLLVKPSGSRLWRLDYRHGGKHKTLALGAYPDVSLSLARERRDAARRLLAVGVDPASKRREEKAAKAATFRLVAAEFLEGRRGHWTEAHHARVKARIERFFSVIGDRPVCTIAAPDLLPVLKGLEQAGLRETARRALIDVGQVLRYGIATGRALHDPTIALRGALAPAKTRHHAAITDPQEFGALLRAIGGYRGEPTVRAALRLLPLVFVRPGELRAAEWSEFDLAGATWTIPGRRMKMRADHLVPLSRQALAILTELRQFTGNGLLVFPGLRERDRPISENTMNAALRRLGFAQDVASSHGFRATARTLLDEQLGERVDLVEHQLGHLVRDPLGRAYNRTSHLPERRRMMQRWSDFCDALRGAK
jgi:integrase